MPRCPVILALLATLAPARPAAAYIAAPSYVESIEWVVADADIVVRGRIIEAVAEGPLLVEGAAPPVVRVTVAVTERMKGKVLGSEVRFRTRRLPFASPLNAAGDWVERGQDAVFCLLERDRDSAESIGHGTKLRTVTLGGSWTTAAYSMRAPSEEGVPSMSLWVETEPERILAAIRRAAAADAAWPARGRPGAQAASWRHPPEEWQRRFPMHGAASGPLEVLMPINGLLEEAARSWLTLDDPQARLDALALLEDATDPRTASAVAWLLDDPATRAELGGLWTQRRYVVRTAARDWLLRRGRIPPRVIVTDPADAEHLPLAWTWPIAAPLGAGFLVAAAAVRRRGRAGRRSAVRFGVIATSLGLALAVTILWIRGQAVADEVQRADGRGALVRLGSFRGGLWVLRFEEPDAGAAPGSWSAGSYPAGELAARWDVGSLASPHWSIGTMGFLVGRGTTASPVGGSPWAVQVVRVPCWALLCIAITPAAWALLGGTARACRRRRRRARGLCEACGYDLRGGDASTCPECGGARTAHGSGDPLEHCGAGFSPHGPPDAG